MENDPIQALHSFLFALKIGAPLVLLGVVMGLTWWERKKHQAEQARFAVNVKRRS